MGRLLVLGYGDTSRLKNEIVKTSTDNICLFEEDSQLWNAHKIISDCGIKEYYVCNIEYKEDIFSILTTIVEKDFNYICPLNIAINDTFVDSYTQQEMYYSNILANKAEHSITIFNSNHANAFFDIDSFIRNVNSEITGYKKAINKCSNLDNLCYVANILKNTMYANVVLACSMLNVQIGNYPNYDFGEVVYNLDYYDFIHEETIFFKKNLSIQTTVENFKNFSNKTDGTKIVPIALILKYVKRILDYTVEKYKGKVYADHTLICIRNEIENCLDIMKQNLIRDYRIFYIDMVKENGYYEIKNKIGIIPIASLSDNYVFV